MEEIIEIYEIQNIGKGIISFTSEEELQLIASFGGAVQQGIQDTIEFNNVIDTEAIVDIEYGSSFTFMSDPISATLSPYLKLETDNPNVSFSTPYVAIGLVDDNFSELYPRTMRRGFVISDGAYYKGCTYSDEEGYGISYKFSSNNEFQNFELDTLINQSFMMIELSKQKVISANYTIVGTDNNRVIYIENGATDITITLNSSSYIGASYYFASDIMNVGFVQRGTGTVTFVASGVTLNIPEGKNKIKGQGYQAFIELQTVGTGAGQYNLLGNLKI